MKRYEQKISEVGLNKGTVSTKIKNMIKEFKEAEEELEQIEKEHAGEEDADKKSSLASKIAEYKKTLEEVEDEIIERIEQFASKKHIYDENIKRMQDAKKAKSGAKTETSEQSAATTEISAEIAPESTEKPEVAAPAAAEPISVVAEEIKPEKKEEKSSGGWIFAGILTVAAILVGVNIMKNRD